MWKLIGNGMVWGWGFGVEIGDKEIARDRYVSVTSLARGGIFGASGVGLEIKKAAS